MVDKILGMSIVNARHLPKCDTFGSCDPYVTIEFGSSRVQTSVRKGTYSPDWGEDFHFPAVTPPPPLVFEVYDWNRTTKSVKIGSCFVPPDQIVDILNHANGWEQTFTFDLKLGSDTVIGNDKHAAVIMVKLRVLAMSSQVASIPNQVGSQSNSRSSENTPGPRRRIGVYLRFADLPAAATTFANLCLGLTQIKTPQITGNQPNFDFHCSMEVLSDDSELVIQLKKPGTLTNSTEIGHASIPLPPVTSYFELPACITTEAPSVQRIQLKDKDGRLIAGAFVTLQIVVVYAPDAQTSLSILAGTWNVGNARPTEKLVQWLHPTQDTFLPDIIFVNSHLAAHQDQVHRRNEDFQEIVLGVKPGLGKFGDIITGFDHCVWVGDLNYRLDLSPLFGADAHSKTPPPAVFDAVVSHAARAEFDALLRFDQLRQASAAGEAFGGFVEGPIGHGPTFKVKRQDRFEYSNERVPAYCDRVLWRSAAGLGGEVSRVWCAPAVTSSDHKPVAARLALRCRTPRPTWWPRPENLAQRDARPAGAGGAGGFWGQFGLDVVPVTWSVEFVSLEGRGLRAADAGGTSDPYVTFGGAACVYEATGGHVPRTLNPVWPADRLPTLVLAAESAAGLRDESLRLCVIDRDSLSADDLLGTALLPLRALRFADGADPLAGVWPPGAGARTATAGFTAEVLYGGVVCGSLLGTIRVTESEPLPLETLWDGRSARSGGGIGEALSRVMTLKAGASNGLAPADSIRFR